MGENTKYLFYFSCLLFAYKLYLLCYFALGGGGRGTTTTTTTTGEEKNPRQMRTKSQYLLLKKKKRKKNYPFSVVYHYFITIFSNYSSWTPDTHYPFTTDMKHSRSDFILICALGCNHFKGLVVTGVLRAKLK